MVISVMGRLSKLYQGPLEQSVSLEVAISRLVMRSISHRVLFAALANETNEGGESNMSRQRLGDLVSATANRCELGALYDDEVAHLGDFCF